MARAIGWGRVSGNPLYRGRKRIVQARLGRKEILFALWFFVIALAVLAGAMYVAWWTLEKEEQELRSGIRECRQFCSCQSLKGPHSSIALNEQPATGSISISYKQKNSTILNGV